jgi:hypothetical protein
MTHVDKKNSIALKLVSGVVFTVLDLNFYNWRWVRPWELIEVEFSKEKCLFEVCKLEMEEERLIVVVMPVRQEVRI